MQRPELLQIGDWRLLQRQGVDKVLRVSADAQPVVAHHLVPSGQKILCAQLSAP
jgi:hypothetical protein